MCHQRRMSALVAMLMAVLGLASPISVSHCVAQGGRLGAFQITTTANPRSVPADGKSAARIHIDVRDTNGNPAPDSTSVLVTTTLGKLGESGFGERPVLTVKTTSGYAIVFATSNTPGSAVVEISVGTSHSEDVHIEFRREGEEAVRAMRVIKINGGWVGYSVELNIIEARDGASVQFGGMTVSGADILQVDVNRMDLRAQPATVTRADKQMRGESLFFQLYTKRGALWQFTDAGQKKVSFDLCSMESRPVDSDLPADAFDFLDADSPTWLVARSITLFMDEKIVLRHARVYVDGQSAMRLSPYWILALPGYSGASNSQMVGLSSSGGLSVNLPLFYRVTDNTTGAIEIQRGAQSGSVVAREGWSLGLREEYRGNEVAGELVLSGLPRSDWGARWHDTRRVFGGALGDFSVSSPDHHSLFVDANVFNYQGSYRNNVRSYYRRPRGSASTYGLSSDWLTSPRRMRTGVDDTFRLGTSVGVRHDSFVKSGMIFDNELYANLDFGAWRLGPQTWLAWDIDNIYSWDTADYSANSARSGLTLEKSFGNNVTTFVDYIAEYGTGDAYRKGWWQGLDLTTWAGMGRWDVYLRGSWDLTDDSTWGSLDIVNYLSDRWRLLFLGTHYKFGDTKYDDIQLGLGWKFWQELEIGLRWSREEDQLGVEFGGVTSTF